MVSLFPVLIKRTYAPFVKCNLAHHVAGGRTIAVSPISPHPSGVQTWPCPPPPVVTDLPGGKYDIEVLDGSGGQVHREPFLILPPEFEVDLPSDGGPPAQSSAMQPTPMGPTPTLPSDAETKLIRSAPIDLRDSENALMSMTTVAGLEKISPGPIAAGKYTVTSVLDPAKKANSVEVGDGGYVESGELNKLNERLATCISFPVETGDLGKRRNADTSKLSQEIKVTPFTVPLYDGTPPAFQIPTAIPQSDLIVVTVGEMALVRSKRREQILLQVCSAGQRTMNVVIPPTGVVSIRLDETAKSICISEYFDDPYANAIVALRKTKQFSALKAVANAARMLDLFVAYSRSSPAAALLIGYMLLRAQEFDAVESSLMVLQDDVRSVMDPDATIMLGQCALMKGESKLALEFFLKSSRKGLPSFSFGQSYLVERLRLYSQASPENKLAAETLMALEPFCFFANYECFFNCYSGESPEKPGPEATNERSVQLPQ